MAKTKSDPEITYKTDNVGVAKAENLMASISSLSPLTLLRSLVAAAVIMMFLGAILMEYTTLKNTAKPWLLNSISSNHPLSSPPEKIYNINGYLIIYCNGGLNQMRSGISDMVAIARYLNVTLIIPELDNTTFWNDPSHFEDIFDADYFIESLKDEVRILKQLPPRLKKRVENKYLYSMTPSSWSDMSYYYNTVLPRIRKYHVVHFLKTEARIANNGLPKDVQRLRCRANYEALRFTPQIEEVGKKAFS